MAARVTRVGAEAPSATPAGIVLGFGLGGFLDGILLHQVLQWHGLVSAQRTRETLGGLQDNVLADGIFHLVTWTFVVVGLALLWATVRRSGGLPSGRALVGWVLVGWGLFNVVDSIVFHWLLEFHHIRPGEHELVYDLGFLALGLALVGGGWLLAARR